MRVLRLVGYNPLQAVSAYRLAEISLVLEKQDGVALVGTCLRKDSQVPCQVAALFKHPFHNELRWGWHPGALTNKACGAGVMLRRSRWPLTKIVKHFPPTVSMQGRFGAVLLRDKFPVLLGHLYFPPRPTRQSDARLFEATCYALYEHALASWLPFVGKAVIAVYMDLNDDFALPANQHELSRDELGAAPVHEGHKERLAASLMRKLCANVGCRMITAFSDMKQTFWGPRRGSGSRIDHWMLSNCACPFVSRCGLLWGAGRQLQVISTARPMDHYPVQLVLEFGDEFIAAHPEPKYNQAAVVECLQRGWKREEVVGAVNTALEGWFNELRVFAIRIQ